MKNEMKDYLDKVKADAELKEKTIAYVRKESVSAKGKNCKGELVFMKKLVGIAAAVLLLGLGTFGGVKAYNSPVAYVSFDINPSVALGLNFLDRVVEIEGSNDDGKKLLEEVNLKNKSVEDAVQLLVKEADRKGYVNENGSSVVALTALAGNENKALDIEERTRERVESMVRNGDEDLIVYADHANLQLRTEAKSYDISPGKFRLIQMLITLDPGLKVDDLKDLKVTDIMLKIHDLLGIGRNKNSQLENFQYPEGEISKAAEQIIKRYQKKIENPGLGDEQQTRNQNQEQVQDQMQNQEETVQQMQEQSRIRQQLQNK